MNASSFLELVEARYRELHDYADHGQVKRAGPGGECNFTTDYHQGGTFRFRAWFGHPYRPLRHMIFRHEIGMDQSKAPYSVSQFHEDAAQRREEESLAMAIAGATGISHGSAHTIGTLLFQDVGGMPLKNWKRLRFRRMRDVDGVLCITISGRRPSAGRMLACFGAEDLLLRRLQWKFTKGHRSEKRRVIDKAVFTSASSALPGIAA
ncbi:hypothetical protein [Pseudoduganella sp. OTU4001]|uniref:hypothetical protein n=1 Tax=Pseudoduganella sp. OTU4001 TaxID=3043854 RepID=UPI00313E3A07